MILHDGYHLSTAVLVYRPRHRQVNWRYALARTVEVNVKLMHSVGGRQRSKHNYTYYHEFSKQCRHTTAD